MQHSATIPPDRLRQARSLLLARGEVPAGLVSEAIARSWRRCLAAGCAPAGRQAEAPRAVAAELARAAARQQELLAQARPVMEHLHGLTRDSGSMVILADADGMLLSTLGDADFLARAERVALMPGASWLEAHRGTNAIGTSLAEGAPVVVHGAEHYVERNAFLTCAAAPIQDPTGRLLGVLDISGDWRGQHPHTFGLVRAAAQMLENQLFMVRHAQHLCLRIHPQPEGIGSLAEGLLALDEDGWLAGANRAALRLLGLGHADLGLTPVARVLGVSPAALIDWGRRRPDEALPARRADGARLFLRVLPGRRAIEARPVARAVATDALAALDTGDARLRAAIERARRVLDKPIPLLLQGETGAGKEVFARAVHAAGPRGGHAFVAVDCSAIPEGLIEAELFGYAPGAYTGARREGAPGRVREAHGGTLFLDEIGDMPPPLQCRLLRVLQERAVTPLGGGKPQAADFALICATHRELKAEVAAGRFRADLYYRINGLTLTLPALRARGDLPALVTRMLAELAPGQAISLEPGVAGAFAAHAWPGNLRELHNALRTACALLEPGETGIGWRHLPEDLAADLRPGASRPAADEDAGPADLRALSDEAMRRALAACAGNLSAAARRLGVSRNTLYRRRRRWAAGRET